MTPEPPPSAAGPRVVDSFWILCRRWRRLAMLRHYGYRFGGNGMV